MLRIVARQNGFCYSTTLGSTVNLAQGANGECWGDRLGIRTYNVPNANAPGWYPGALRSEKEEAIRYLVCTLIVLGLTASALGMVKVKRPFWKWASMLSLLIGTLKLKRRTKAP